jgi:SagB-type dehydrogenase family enzyme
VNHDSPKNIRLPDPITTGGLPLMETIAARRSIRGFTEKALQLYQLSQILWAAQGVTSAEGEARAVPSAGATYPLEIYTVTGENGVEKIESGIYQYAALNHSLSLHRQGDWRADLANAALNQDFIAVAPVTLVICAD